MVYGLRYYYRLMGMNKNAVALPSLKKETKLPVVLNQGELKELFAAPALLKHRVLLSLIYSAGLRGQEAINLKISDIDFERRTIHIRQSKYKKDRMVPLADSMAVGLRKYPGAENPHIWLFNGKEPDGRYSVKGLSWVMRENLKKTSISKDVNLHSLRHSYATHLLEQGLNIVTLKELLGHADIAATMVYLHVSQCPLIRAHSPLDTLYNYKGNARKVWAGRCHRSVWRRFAGKDKAQRVAIERACKNSPMPHICTWRSRTGLRGLRYGAL
jgi:site-specific recombinase XerD